MNALSIAVFACVAAICSASIIGTHVDGHGGAIVSGPSGVVTSHGAIGPAGHGIIGHGIVGHGIVGHGGWGHAGILDHGVHGGAIIAGPVAHAAVVGPAVLGHGIVGLGHGIIGHGHGIIDHGHGIGHHGVVVSGPHTAPAVIDGPSGKVVADGLWGPTSHWAHGDHHGYAHGW